MMNKQKLYQIALNLLEIGNNVIFIENHFNKEGFLHRVMTINPELHLEQRFYLNDSDSDITEDSILTQIETNLDELKDLLNSIVRNMFNDIKKGE